MNNIEGRDKEIANLLTAGMTTAQKGEVRKR